MADPTAQQLPAIGQTNIHEFVLQRLMGQAFDAYVLDGADLLTELTDAQTTADQINTCLGDDLTPADVSERTEECVDSIAPELFN